MVFRRPKRLDKKKPKRSTPNIYHRNKNTVRTKPRKVYGTGPVVKGMAFGRHAGRNPDKRRYT